MFILIILLTIGFGFLFIFLNIRDKNSSKLAIEIKALASISFLLVGITAMVLSIKKGGNIISLLLMVFGLLFGVLGDVLLDLKAFYKYKNKKWSDLYTYLGMSAFGVGHIFYITAICINISVSFVILGIAIAIGAILTASILFVSIFVLKMNYGKFIGITIAYTFLLTTLIGLVACATYITKATNLIVLLVATICFLASDMVLSTTYFSKEEKYSVVGWKNPESRQMIVVNHILYYIAQYMIAVVLLIL